MANMKGTTTKGRPRSCSLFTSVLAMRRSKGTPATGRVILLRGPMRRDSPAASSMAETPLIPCPPRPRDRLPVTDENGRPFFGENYEYRYGRMETIRKGENIALVAAGNMLPVAVEACRNRKAAAGELTDALERGVQEMLDRHRAG